MNNEQLECPHNASTVTALMAEYGESTVGDAISPLRQLAADEAAK